MARSPVTLMVEQFNSLTEVEQKVFLDLVDPQPEPEQTVKVKRSRKMKAEAPAQKRGLPPDDGQLCIAKIPGLGVDCNDPADNKVHDPNAGYAGYHPFLPPAQPLAKRSSRKGSGTNSEASTETKKETASAVGASGG